MTVGHGGSLANARAFQLQERRCREVMSVEMEDLRHGRAWLNREFGIIMPMLA